MLAPLYSYLKNYMIQNSWEDEYTRNGPDPSLPPSAYAATSMLIRQYAISCLSNCTGQLIFRVLV